MEEIIVKIDGMMCGMCESHMNDCIRQNFKVKKVSSSHAKGETVILTEEEVDEEKLKAEIAKTGYRVTAIARHPYEKKGLFSSLLHKK